MKYASAQKATTVAITDSPLSPLAQHASHVLLARSDMVSFVDSLVGPLSIDRPHCHGGHQRKRTRWRTPCGRLREFGMNTASTKGGREGQLRF